MILVREGLSTYKKVCKLTRQYGYKLKTDEDVEKFLSYLKGHGVQVDRADYEGSVIDLEIGTVGITISYDLVPSPFILMMNVANTDKSWDYEKDIGGWVEYDTNKDIIRFPFMSM